MHCQTRLYFCYDEIMQAYSNDQLFKELSALNVVDQEKLSLLSKQAGQETNRLYQLVLDSGLLRDDHLGQLIASILDLPPVILKEIKIENKVLSYLSPNFAKANQIVCFAQTADSISVATSRPWDQALIDKIRIRTGKSPIVFYATPKDLEDTLISYKKDAETLFAQVIDSNVESATKDQRNEPPIIKIIDTLIEFADQKKASDIHIEPIENDSLIRFRIDGVMTDIVTLPGSIHPRLVTRVKVMSRLRTDEHQAAQDGKISWINPQKNAFGNTRIDIRVSIIPATDGEKVVMRLLSEKSRALTLDNLGFSTRDLKKIESAYKKPHGMILSTGPTGSGKTTTMYTIIKLLNKREINISTIEDPVEYDIEGITQIQVNKKTDLTFAKGLRSLVRQDPDVILVGEIRDTETADIAVNAAMTGHLVLSTLHTNDSTTTIPRLIDMGVEPFLISSTINIIIAQRLVRKIHLKCRESIEVEMADLEKSIEPKYLKKLFGDKKTVRIYKGQGCDICHHSGYEDRVGIYEVLTVDEEIRQAIIEKKDAATIREIAIKNGMTTMMQDGLEKVAQGITSFEEVVRVTQEFE